MAVAKKCRVGRRNFLNRTRLLFFSAGVASRIIGRFVRGIVFVAERAWTLLFHAATGANHTNEV